MPIKRLLTGSSFAPESFAILAEIYETALRELGYAPLMKREKRGLPSSFFGSRLRKPAN
jgi:hypothetical protein